MRSAKFFTNGPYCGWTQRKAEFYFGFPANRYSLCRSVGQLSGISADFSSKAGLMPAFGKIAGERKSDRASPYRVAAPMRYFKWKILLMSPSNSMPQNVPPW